MSSSTSSSSTSAPSASSSSIFNPLSYSHPPRSTTSNSHSGPSDSKSQLSPTRLYVGNLHPSTTDYDLVQLFSPYGKLAKLDLLFHKVGPLRGQPRGYAFVEYVRGEDARAAHVQLSSDEGGKGKEVRGRRISVGFAKVTEYSDAGAGAGTAASTGPIRRGRRGEDEFKPTTLSLVKNSQRPQSTDAKIAAMDAKLRALKASKSKASDPSSGSSSPASSAGTSSMGAKGGTSTLGKVAPGAGLPEKPRSTGVGGRT